MNSIDFSRSYFRFRVDLHAQAAITLSHTPPTSENNVRINLESVCVLTNSKTGQSTRYVLGASCKTERVGGPGDLWLQPNADFCPIVSDEDFLILKSWQKNDMGVMRNPATLGMQPERQIGKAREAWTEFSTTVREAPGTELKTLEEIVAGIRSDDPLVSHTEYTEGDYHVAIAHPIKTINFAERDGVYQTDTGPLLLPDLSAERIEREENIIGCFNLAYSAFNAPDWAEFIVNVPTPLTAEIGSNHYSRSRRIEGVRNSVVRLEG